MASFCFTFVFIGLTMGIIASSAPLEGENDDLSIIVKNLQDEIADIKEDREKSVQTIHSMEHEMEAMRKHDRTLQKEIAQLKGSLNEAVGFWTDDKQMTADSMFFATISEYSVPISEGEAIIWNSAPINPGGHFNTVLGMYTAPVHGYYTFSVNKYSNNSFGSFLFLVDEERVALHYIYSSETCCPNGDATINLELSAGQTVRIENTLSVTIFGTDADGVMHSWFTGHLLYAL